MRTKGGLFMYQAVELSKYIVTKCAREDCPISNLQLQKILYFIQKAYLKQGSQAFADETEAWQFGPVVPNVYYYFSGYGAMPIWDDYDYSGLSLTAKDHGIIDPIVEEKRQLAPWDLVNETHKLGGAWDHVYRSGLGNRCIIPTNLIKELG